MRLLALIQLALSYVLLALVAAVMLDWAMNGRMHSATGVMLGMGICVLTWKMHRWAKEDYMEACEAHKHEEDR